MTSQVVTAVSVALPLAANLKLFRTSLGHVELAANVRPVYIGLTHICYMRGSSCIAIPPFHLDRASIWTYVYKPRSTYRMWRSTAAYAYAMHTLICMHPPVQVLLLGAAAVFAAWGTHSGLQEVGLL